MIDFNNVIYFLNDIHVSACRHYFNITENGCTYPGEDLLQDEIVRRLEFLIDHFKVIGVLTPEKEAQAPEATTKVIKIPVNNYSLFRGPFGKNIKDAGINFLEDFTSLTEKEVRRIPWVGHSRLCKIKKILNNCGLKLKNEN